MSRTRARSVAVFDALVESLAEGVLFETAERRIFAVNTRLCEIFGLHAAPEQLIGTDCSDAAERNKEQLAEPAAFSRRIDEILAAARPVLGEEVRFADGRIFERDYLPVREDGHLIGHLWRYRDVTEERLAEDARRRSEQTTRALLEAIPDLMFRMDREGTYLDFIPAKEFPTFVPPSEFLGRRLEDVMPPEVAARARRHLEQAFATNGTQVFEYRLTMDRRPRDFEARLVRCGEDEVLAIVRDISERTLSEQRRRQLEEQSHKTQRLESLGVLAGGIAHDFNNLLTSVLGHAGLAQTRLSPDHPVHDSIRAIELSARRAAELTSQLLAFSGKGRFVIERLGLSRLVRETATPLEQTVDGRAALHLELPDDLPAIDGDAAQLRQLLTALVTNAAEATADPTGPIHIRTGVERVGEGGVEGVLADGLAPGPYVFLEVEDDGAGMDRETLSRIFDPFFSTRFVGRGLGLAAVLGIVRGHRGNIRVRSEPGRGSAFRVLLPAAGAADGSATRDAASGAQLPPGTTVLVVDDEPVVRDVARSALERAGARVLEAGGAGSAIGAFREHGEAIDAVLLDLTMPGRGGDEVLHAIRGTSEDTPVLLSSGYPREDVLSRHRIDDRTAGFIQKPYGPRALIDALGALIRAVAGGGSPP